jgi:hypothetical protein
VRVVIEGHTLPGRACGPYLDVEVGVQVKQDTVDVVPADAAEARWEQEIRRTADGDWRGPAVHGPKGERFLYLVWRGREGASAPLAGFRRAKLRLDAVPADVAEAAGRSGVLVGRLALTDARGMPVCASVRPPDGIAWTAT